MGSYYTGGMEYIIACTSNDHLVLLSHIVRYIKYCALVYSSHIQRFNRVVCYTLHELKY